MKQVISKPLNTVVLRYLALNALYVCFFSEIDLISVKIVVLNYFCDTEKVLSLI